MIYDDHWQGERVPCAVKLCIFSGTRKLSRETHTTGGRGFVTIGWFCFLHVGAAKKRAEAGQA